MSEKYGFVYIWYDRKHKRFYIGSHWGTENDGYICSSTWMRNAYKRRPFDFKRRIIDRNIQDKKDLLQIEDKILRKIPFEKLGIRYYNLKNHAQGNHSYPHREETKRKISEAQLGSKNHMFGKFHSEEARKKISDAGKNKKLKLETRRKISETRLKKIESGDLVIVGHKHNEISINKIKEKRALQVFSEESKKKMSESAKGRKWYKCQETGKRVFYKESVV
jgi:hypothetical protein